jgi:hypothetical protein
MPEDQSRTTRKTGLSRLSPDIGRRRGGLVADFATHTKVAQVTMERFWFAFCVFFGI